jgi:entericidin A
MSKLILLVLGAAAIALTGCNTVAGFGKDLSKVGDKIEKKSEQVQK